MYANWNRISLIRSLGFQICRYGYESTEDIRQVVERTRDAGIPQVIIINIGNVKLIPE